MPWLDGMNMIEYVISIASSLTIAIIAVYFDRFLASRKERKTMLASILSEIETNLVIVDQIEKQILHSEGSLEQGKIPTMPFFSLREDAFRFAQTQGIVQILKSEDYQIIFNPYVFISHINKWMSQYEILRFMPLSGGIDIWKGIIRAMEAAVKELEQSLFRAKKTMERNLGVVPVAP